MKKLTLLLIVFSLLFAFGCKKGDKGTDEKTDAKTEESKDKKSEDNKSAGSDLGLSTGIPADFPKDVPQPKNSKPLSYIKTSEGTVVSFETKENIKDVVEFYKSEMKSGGFTSDESAEIMSGNEIFIGLWKKMDREISVVISVNTEENNTLVVITYK
ncbi:MAG: hypothetical protein FJ216_05360 [Ignavibacteria bacterium]|nr:hypothetical protein [Ignavibacteria bacterium]